MKNLRAGNVYFFNQIEINNIIGFIEEYKKYSKSYILCKAFGSLVGQYMCINMYGHAEFDDVATTTEFLDKKRIEMCNSIGITLAAKAKKILSSHSKYKSFKFDYRKDLFKLVEYFQYQSNKTDYSELYETLLNIKAEFKRIQMRQAIKEEIRLSRRYEEEEQYYHCETCKDYGCYECRQEQEYNCERCHDHGCYKCQLEHEQIGICDNCNKKLSRCMCGWGSSDYFGDMDRYY